jgi:hypothetical protein
MTDLIYLKKKLNKKKKKKKREKLVALIPPRLLFALSAGFLCLGYVRVTELFVTREREGQERVKLGGSMVVNGDGSTSQTYIESDW